MIEHDRRAVIVLAVAQALYLSAAAVVFTFSGLAGYALAEDKALATLPVALMTVATAVATVPASLLMARIGRRRGFVLGALFGAASGAVSTVAIMAGNFALFCLGGTLMGVFQGFAMYYRFAAADAVDPSGKAKAVSWVLAGGVAAALVGPQIAAWSRSALPTAEFAGSYLAVVVLSLLSIVVLGALRMPTARSAEVRGGRPLLAIARQPAFIVAVLNAAIAYGVMSFVMTASPLAVVAEGHGADAAASVTSWHLLGMFLPSFVTGSLIARLGLVRVLLAGAGLLLASGATALANPAALSHYHIALLLLGVGWNFLFIGGTTLLAETYRPAERAKVQAANEFVVFGASAAAALAAGGVQTGFGWAAVNWSAVPLVVVAAAATLWLASRMKRSPARA
jgi:MFS family permease